MADDGEQKVKGEAQSHSYPTPIIRAEGVTDAESYLKSLCDKSLLSLWGYPGLYRDQGNGKEICDFLVVFENHIIIFSDKACDFPDSGNLQIDWNRWFRRAVLDSAKQIWGAERWIKEHPDRIFVDRACTQPFPYDLPNPAHARFHRVVVAHRSVDRCKREIGGSGTLRIDSRCVGDMHLKSVTEGGCGPFTVGHLDSTHGFVHVLDDVTLDILLSSQDTVSDFISYLIRKERFLCSDVQVLAGGEEELLAYYLTRLDDHDIHDFVIQPSVKSLSIEEGQWERFLASPERKAQEEADRISYAWDGLIERFNHHLFAGTQYYTTHASIREQERGLRFLAREGRTRRRMLADALVGMLRTTPPNMRRLRVLLPSAPGDPHFVLLLLPHPTAIPYDKYREARREFLFACCLVAKLRFRDAEDIVGIATETARGETGSEDLVYYDARSWSDEDRKEAERLQRIHAILREPTMIGGVVNEYPIPTNNQRPVAFKIPFSPIPRRQPCPCGSGKRYKNCCGRQRQ